jgi:hypothetical protein
MSLSVSSPSITRILAFITYPFERFLYFGRIGITRFLFTNASHPLPPVRHVVTGRRCAG